MAPLDEYRRKRDFRRTPEPQGGETPGEGRSGGSFVIQKHDASRLHFDLRLERDGVLKSWAVPKGPSLVRGEKRLAVHVEDHPLEYGEFEGVIPEAEYGGGTVMLWDRGQWTPAGKDTEDHIDFRLEGRKLRGYWSLIRMRGGKAEDEDNWLLIRRSKTDLEDGPKPARRTGVRRKGADHAGSESDEELFGDDDRSVLTGRTMAQIAEDRDAVWTSEGLQLTGASPGLADVRPDPEEIAGAKRLGRKAEEFAPQLATAATEAPAGDEWLCELKLDGYRIVAQVRDGEVELRSRNGKLWTARFPEVANLLRRMRTAEAVLDGELVAYSPDGSTSFRRLQEALSKERTEGLVYQVFDLLALDGWDLREVPLEERKSALRRLFEGEGFTGQGGVRYTDHIVGKGPRFFEQACSLGLEGIICKRASAPYGAGRNRNWLKVKCARSDELVVGGYTDPAGSRSGFGALLLGYYTPKGDLRFAGRVGTGFNERQLVSLHRRLQELEIAKSPFVPRPPGKGFHWVKPELVAEVDYTEWTRDGSLRHPSFKGLREDKDPREIGIPEGLAGKAPKTGGQAAPAIAKKRTAGSAGGEGQSPDVKPAAAGRSKGGTVEIAGVRLTSPEKVLYPEQGTTKLELANYYQEVAEWIVPFIENRPLSLVRCPDGTRKQCFFQKHPGEGLFEQLKRIEIMESDGPEPYLYVTRPSDLVALVQGGVLELHVWGSRVDDVEKPDMLVFDLDPSPDVPWDQMLRVARDLRDRLAQLELESFPRTTGGKGLHLVVPLRRRAGWEEVKEFARAVAAAHAADDARITTNMSKAKRGGKIYLDYLRNGRGSTAICSYSTRSREGAPVAVPVRWDEVNAALRPDRYDIHNIRRRLGALSGDPWEGFDSARRTLTKKLMEKVGV